MVDRHLMHCLEAVVASHLAAAVAIPKTMLHAYQVQAYLDHAYLVQAYLVQAHLLLAYLVQA